MLLQRPLLQQLQLSLYCKGFPQDLGAGLGAGVHLAKRAAVRLDTDILQKVISVVEVRLWRSSIRQIYLLNSANHFCSLAASVRSVKCKFYTWLAITRSS